MRWLMFLSLIVSSLPTLADVGRIAKTSNDSDSFLLRKGFKKPLTSDLALKAGDVISTTESMVLLHLLSGSQILLGKKTELRITNCEQKSENEKTMIGCQVELLKGVTRTLVPPEKNREIRQVVSSGQVSFIGKAGEFEVSTAGTGEVDVDVISGEVEATSPLIMTFVPEMIKEKEGLRFSIGPRTYSRRKFSLKMQDPLSFSLREEIIPQGAFKKPSKRNQKKAKAKRKARKQG